MAVLLKTDVLTPWLPTAGSRSNSTTKTFPAQKATSESFPCPPRSLFPAKTRFTANSRKSALQKCILPRPPSPPPGLGSVPKVGAPLRGFLPYLSQGQASWDAAQPTYHGDSRRGRASSGSGCLGTGAGTRSPGRTSKVGSLRQKNKLQTPKHSQEPMETQIGLHPGGIRDAR